MTVDNFARLPPFAQTDTGVQTGELPYSCSIIMFSFCLSVCLCVNFTFPLLDM